MRNLSDPRTKLPQLFRALGQTAAEVAPVAETQAELFKNLDITFRAFANVAQAVHPAVDRPGPAGARGRDAGVPAAAAVPAQQRAVLQGAASRRPRAALRRAEPRRRVRDRHRSRSRARRRSTSELETTFDGAAALRRGPAGRAGRQGPDEHGAAAQPDDRVPHARADDLQLRDDLVPQRRLAAQRGRQERHRPALHRRRGARTAPTTRAARRRRRPTAACRARRTTTCTPTRTRTPRAPGQPERVRGGQRERTSPASRSIGNVPGNQGTAHRRPRSGA